MAEENPRPLTDVRELSRVAYGFMASKTLFAALDLDLFSHLAAGRSQIADLVDASGVAANRLVTLLSALTAIGLIVRADSGFANSPAAERYLVRSAREYFGDYYRLQIDKQIFPTFLHLSDGIAGRPGPSVYELIQDREQAEIFSSSQYQASVGPAILVSRIVDLAGCRTLLDVAGGSGAFSIQFSRKHPELRATILDFPSVLEDAKRFVERSGVGDRITFLPGDALEVDWPRDQDAVLISYLLSGVRTEAIQRLLELARESLAAGGRLLIHDFMLDERRDGPMEAAVWFVSYLSHTPDAISFSDTDISERLRSIGFSDVHSMPLIPGITKLVTASR